MCHPHRAFHALALEQRFLLRLERHGDQLAEHLTHSERVEIELSCPPLDPREQLAFALVVTQERQALGLQPCDVGHRVEPFTQQLDDPSVVGVEAIAESPEVVHGARL